MSKSYASLPLISHSRSISETSRLQIDVDLFTKNLEIKKRRLIVLDDLLKQLKDEVRAKKRKIRESKVSPDKRGRPIISRAAELKCQIKHERMLLDEARNKNEELKGTIDRIRKDLMQGVSGNRKLTRNISKTKMRAKSTNRLVVAGRRRTSEAYSHMVALNSKHEEDKSMFDVQMSEMQHRLRSKDDVPSFEERGLHLNIVHGQMGLAAEFSNPILVLKQRLAKIKA